MAAGDAVLLCPQSPDGNAVAVDEREGAETLLLGNSLSHSIYF